MFTLLFSTLVGAAQAQGCATVGVGEVLPLSALVDEPCVELAPNPAELVVLSWAGATCTYANGRFALGAGPCFPDPRYLSQEPTLRWSRGGAAVLTEVSGAPTELVHRAATYSGSTIALPVGDYAPAEVVLFRPGERPVRLSGAGGRYPAPSPDLADGWLLADASAYALKPGAAPPTPPAPAPADTCALTSAEQEVYDPRSTQLVCVDATRPGQPPRAAPPMGAILKPNTSLLVRLRCPGDGLCEASLGGQAGFTQGTVDTVRTRAASGESNKSEGDELPPQERTLVFLPRQPGVVQLSVTTSAGTRAVAEWVVPQPVSGAVRLGIAVGSVGDFTFSALTAPGSSTPEIIVGNGGFGQPELVLGWAPFLQRGGRLYEDPARGGPLPGRHNLAPYFGLGVVAAGEDGEAAISLLRSAYLGLEWEPRRSTSLALTATVRRVDTLPEPLEVGGPAGGSTVTTVPRWMPGVAVVFNLSPEFFELAGQPLSLGGT